MDQLQAVPELGACRLISVPADPSVQSMHAWMRTLRIDLLITSHIMTHFGKFPGFETGVRFALQVASQGVLSMKSSLAIALLSAFTFAGAEENVHTNAVYASPLSMIVYSSITDIAVISAAYEHRLSRSGYSLFVPLHAAYRENETELRYALGMGLGLRKYFGTSFSGSYLTGQTDLTRYQTSVYEDAPAYMDQNGNWIYTSSDRRVEQFLSITQVAYGYKWDWRQFTLDLSLGGAFYAKDDEKYTSLIGGVNIGFPFNAGMFGFR